MKVSGIKEFLLEKFTSKKAALMEWQSSVPVSYRMYIYGIAIPLPLAIIAFIFFPKHINGAGLFFVSIMAILLIIGFLLDFIAFFRKIYKTWLGKLVYSILAYVAYLFAEFYSKTIIYDITATNPELYSTAINIFILIFILPSWLFLIMVFFMVIIIILFILSIVTLPIDMFLKSMFGSSYFPEKLNFLLKKMNTGFRVHGGVKSHMFLFCIGLFLFIFLVLRPVAEKTVSLIHPSKSIASKIIFFSSYYQNNSCVNINKDTYIRLLEGDYVAKVNMNTNELDKIFQNHEFVFSKPEKCIF